MIWLTTFICAFILGAGLAVWVDQLIRRERKLLGLASPSARTRWLRASMVIVITVGMCELYRWASIDLQCLETAEVRPSGWGQNCRLVYQCALIGLLIVATAIDFDCYMIPDSITIPGMLIGVLGACFIQDVQICHLWVDWSQAVPQLRGPYIPEWYSTHRFWHALAWSGSGLVVGAGITALARYVSSRLLGQEAMGFGDVTLMAMIGSFVGWQAVTLVFLIAPLTGIVIGVPVRMLSGKTYLPYGPWLSIATGILLLTWTHLWRLTRLIFSDWMSVAVLAAVGGAGFVLLLVLLQLYKSIPTRG